MKQKKNRTKERKETSKKYQTIPHKKWPNKHLYLESVQN